jgi:hypothetical protein
VHSLQTSSLLLRTPPFALKSGLSTKPDWQGKHVLSLLSCGLYVETGHSTAAAPGVDGSTYPAEATASKEKVIKGAAAQAIGLGMPYTHRIVCCAWC